MPVLAVVVGEVKIDHLVVPRIKEAMNAPYRLMSAALWLLPTGATVVGRDSHPPPPIYSQRYPRNRLIRAPSCESFSSMRS